MAIRFEDKKPAAKPRAAKEPAAEVVPARPAKPEAAAPSPPEPAPAPSDSAPELPFAKAVRPDKKPKRR